MPSRLTLNFAVALAVAASGCGGLGTYDVPCYDDSACENGTVCRSGDCVLQCVTAHECPAAAPLCEYNRCIAHPAADALLPDLLPFVDLSPPPGDAAMSSADAALSADDAASVTPDVAVVTPDAAAVTPDATAVTPDAAAVTPDAAAATPDAGP